MRRSRISFRSMTGAALSALAMSLLMSGCFDHTTQIELVDPESTTTGVSSLTEAEVERADRVVA